MARGWESKSIEEQQAQAGPDAPKLRAPLSPQQIAKERQQQLLRLSRQRVLQQLEMARNPQHREMLNKALADLDTKLAGWARPLVA